MVLKPSKLHTLIPHVLNVLLAQCVGRIAASCGGASFVGEAHSLSGSLSESLDLGGWCVGWFAHFHICLYLICFFLNFFYVLNSFALETREREERLLRQYANPRAKSLCRRNV